MSLFMLGSWPTAARPTLVYGRVILPLMDFAEMYRQIMHPITFFVEKRDSLNPR